MTSSDYVMSILVIAAISILTNQEPRSIVLSNLVKIIQDGGHKYFSASGMNKGLKVHIEY